LIKLVTRWEFIQSSTASFYRKRFPDWNRESFNTDSGWANIIDAVSPQVTVADENIDLRKKPDITLPSIGLGQKKNPNRVRDQNIKNLFFFQK